jgi:spermidine synthase
MIPRVLIDTAEIPGSKETLRLIQRGAEFSIMLGANELMNSRLSGSEEALATLACTKISQRGHARILIGGLGMGFTLRAALTALGRDAEITVAELVPAVVAWAEGPMADHHGPSLSDPRTHIVIEDITRLIRESGSGYDAILLDVDNGPDGLTKGANDHLYSSDGLGRAWHALRSGGVLAIWSAAPDKSFAERLRMTGFAIEETIVRAHKGKAGARHVIWLATKAEATMKSPSC